MITETIFDFEKLDFERPGKSFYQLSFIHDGDWASILVPLIVINGEKGPGPGVAIFGGTHGNEFEGQVAALKLAHELDPSAMSGRVLLMPRLNPPACAAVTRESPLDRGNMNRAFPGKPDGTITYRIAHFVSTYIFPKASVVVDIHAGGTKLRFPVLPAVLESADASLWNEAVNTVFLFDAPFVGVGSASLQLGTPHWLRLIAGQGDDWWRVRVLQIGLLAGPASRIRRDSERLTSQRQPDGAAQTRRSGPQRASHHDSGRFGRGVCSCSVCRHL